MVWKTREMVRRLGFIGGILLTLVFAMPAFESHACAAEPPFSSAVVEAGSSGEQNPACPDCGPACANGCCHAPHAIATVDRIEPRAPSVRVRPSTDLETVGLPFERPAGPERPPRV